ncbi:serine-threonine protein kinase, putative [Entamoeba invadens IP1]|uniref:Serine-threonine protein kinase, putative n=1 Tax=Entamoeba invadens IP1 TaxID=370355 RepID=A0A0A1U144_ENTIV|nr:serine-threonine protein kinase, putative [Entamoeba invadens IP1]ELP87730.1 serine-threonine protein kinase, putative [Entamoeba invadens IP1]|eukprot:XP_004254501.1 serine-threonine protein kinase, putative [Entamoeba invadens IP1]
MMLFLSITLLFYMFHISQSQTCDGTGCVNCIANNTCESCGPLYEQSDNSCTVCKSVNPQEPISAANPLIVLEDGVCTDKTNQLRTKFDDIVPLVLEGAEQTHSFNLDTSTYSIGPCDFPLNKQLQYRMSIWFTLDLSTSTATLYDYYKFILKTPLQSPTLYIDITQSPPSTSQSYDLLCYARQTIVPGGGEVVLPLFNKVYYIFVSVDQAVNTDFTVSVSKIQKLVSSEILGGTYFSINQTVVDDLIQTSSSKLYDLSLSSNGIYIYPICTPTKLLKGVFFSVNFDGDHSLLIDTTKQNRYCYLMEFSKEGNVEKCVDFWVGDWWGIWTDSWDQALRVRLLPNKEKTRLFFLGMSEHATDIQMSVEMFCPNQCHESSGNGVCSLKLGKCVCNEKYGASDCRKLCYYNGNFYNDDTEVSGDGMCIFGSVHCNDDCKCVDSQTIRNYCATSACKSKQLSSEVLCLFDTDNCLPNCVCAKGYTNTPSGYCKLETCGDGIKQSNEECDGGIHCNETCGCESGYEPFSSIDNLGCYSPPVPWWAFLIIAVVVVFLVVVIIITLFVLIRQTRPKRPDWNVYKHQQPIYYHDITHSVLKEPSVEARYAVDPLNLDYGKGDSPTKILDTRFEQIEIKNFSKNKYMMFVVHTPNSPKYIFHFDSQITYFRPRQEICITSYMTLHCTTKIMDMKINFTVYWSKHLNTLKKIEKLLKDKTVEKWKDSDKQQMDLLMKDVPRKNHYFFEIKTMAESSTFIDLDDLQLIEEPLSQGMTGTVYLGKYKSNAIVMKTFQWEDLTETETEELKNDITEECELMSKIRCPYIAGYIGSITYIPQISIVLDYFFLGSLEDYIRIDNESRITLPYRLKVRMLQDTARGIELLHYNNVVHLNLKPSNMLVTSFYADSVSVIKISDFGKIKSRKKLLINDKSNGVVYIAPEVFQNKYSNACDSYSFSVVAWELFYAEEPFKEIRTADEVIQNVLNGNHLFMDSSMPPLYREIIEDCCSENPEKRINFTEIQKKVAILFEQATTLVEIEGGSNSEKLEQVVHAKNANANNLLSKLDRE